MKVILYEQEFEIDDKLSPEEKEDETNRLAIIAAKQYIDKTFEPMKHITKEDIDRAEAKKISKMTPNELKSYKLFKERMSEPIFGD